MADSVTVDPPRRIEGEKLSELYAKASRRFPESRRRIIFCRDLQRGAIGVPAPSTYTGVGGEIDQVLVVSHPIKKMLPLQMTAKLARKYEKATIKRFPLAPNDGARKAATDFETWDNAVVSELVPRRSVIGRLIQQGECALFVQPSPSEYLKSPSYMDTVNGDDGKETRKPRPLYDRDTRGRSPGERGYGKRDESSSAKAHRDDSDAYQARRLPFSVRVESPLNCFPILARGRGKEPWDTIGIVCRTLYEREELIRRKYRWPGQDNTALIPTEASSSTYGAYGQIYLYEAWMIDEDDNPYISYSAGGHATTMDDESPAIIDLKEEYGLCRLPCKYIWGNHLEDEPDERGVPLLDPIAVAILNVEAHLTHELLYGKRTAMPGFGIDINPELPATAFLDDKGQLKSYTMPSEGGLIALPGRIVPLVAPRVGDSLRYVTDQLLGQVAQSTPDASVVGGGGGASGHQDVIQNEYFEASQEMILESARQALEFVGEIVAELACTAAKGEWRVLDGEGVEIPCYVNAEVTPGNDTAKTSQLRTISTFKERWVGPGIYDLTAVYPNEGNLAETQQTADLADRGYASFEDVMESRGKTAPENERAKIDADRWYKSEPGLIYLSQRFAAHRGDLEAQEKAKLQFEGLLSGGPEPLPTAALAQPEPVMVPQPQGPMPGVQMPNMAASSLAGAVGGAMQTGPILADAAAQSMIPGGI